MADDLVNPGSTAANTSAGAPVPVSAQLVLRDPASLFSAGDVVSGRVVQGLGAGQYVLIMRGTTMVVSSQVPLTADTVMRFHVLTSGSQVNLRVVACRPSACRPATPAAWCWLPSRTPGPRWRANPCWPRPMP